MRESASWFANLSTRSKLLAGFSLIGAALVLVIGMAIAAFESHRSTLADLQAYQLTNAIDLWTLEEGLSDNRVRLYKVLMEMDDPRRDPTLGPDLAESAARNKGLLKAIAARNSNGHRDSKELDSRIGALKADLDQYYDIRDNVVVPLISAGRLDAARDVANGQLSGAYAGVRKQVREMTAIASREAQETVRESKHQIIQLTLVFTLVALAGIAVAVGMALTLDRLIAVPLGQMAAIARETTLGNLDVRVPETTRTDEVGQLAREFDAMVAARRELVDLAERIADGDLTVRVHPRSDKDILAHSLNLMAENLQGLVRELQEGADAIDVGDLEALGQRLKALAGALMA